MDLNLEGKRAIVCGSTQGIGREIALQLAGLGASITLIARNEEKLKELLKQLPKAAGTHDYLVADFSKIEELKTQLEKYAPGKTDIQILINNTGGPAPGKASEAGLSEFTQAFSQHLLCNQLLTRAFLPSMKKNQYGRIINIISTSVKEPIKGLGVSNTIRAAVANWAKTISIELAPYGITVNNILPGATATSRLENIIKSNAEKKGISREEIEKEMKSEIPVGRFASPAEVAAAAVFLCTPSASYINGINLPVDGGRTGCL